MMDPREELLETVIQIKRELARTSGARAALRKPPPMSAARKQRRKAARAARRRNR